MGEREKERERANKETKIDNPKGTDNYKENRQENERQQTHRGIARRQSRESDQ